MTNDKLEQITAQKETIQIDDVEFTVNPLSVKQFTKAQLKGENDESAALVEMMYYSLQEEDITRDELMDAPAKLLIPLQETVMGLNDFEDFFDEDEKQEALNKLQ